MNQTLKTVVLLSALTALFAVVGRLVAGPGGMIFGLLFAGLINVAAYWWSDKIVLKMHGAKSVRPDEAPQLYRMVRDLADRQGLPMPALYVVPESAPNAFATGRDPKHAAVAVTAGLLELLTKEELEGVVAHELGHVANRDTLVSTIAATIAGGLSAIADMAFWGSLFGGHRDSDGDSSPAAGIAAIVIAPFAGLLLQTAILRTREFMADAHGAKTTDNPLALASALQKIEAWKQEGTLTTANPGTASLFIINPLAGRSLMHLFSTHPPTRERVHRLEKMSAHIGPRFISA